MKRNEQNGLDIYEFTSKTIFDSRVNLKTNMTFQ